MIISGTHVYCEFCGGSIVRGRGLRRLNRVCCSDCDAALERAGVREPLPELPRTTEGRVRFIVAWLFAYLLLLVIAAGAAAFLYVIITLIVRSMP